MKKLLIAFAAVALSAATAHADTAFDGLYAGVSGAYGSSRIDGGDRDKGFSGGAFAGYGTSFGKVYLGGEAGIGLSGIEHDAGGVSVEQKLNYGATARVGYVATPKVLAYGLAGWERAEVEIDDGTSVAKETDDGLKFGLGAETFIKDNLAARTELTYTDWKGRNGVPASDEIKTSVGVALHF